VTTALIMAGGRGERMARSGATLPKPLVEVAGVPLVERNLLQLAGAGIGRVVVAVGGRATPVRRVVTERLVPLGRVLGVEVEELVEDHPLGNIGAAGLLRGRVDELLVVYADNLTTVDLAALVDEHRAHRPAMTLAAHHEPFTVPYGELVVDGPRLVRYTEKPTLQVLVGSAVMVIGRAGLAALAPDRPTGISELAQGLVDAGEEVRVRLHDAAWVDVNDVGSVARAEAVVACHPEMEAWLGAPDEHWSLDLDLDPSGAGPVDAARVCGARHRWQRRPAGALDDAEVPLVDGDLGPFDVVDLRRRRTLRVVATATALADAPPGVADVTPGVDDPDVAWVAARVANRLTHGRPPARVGVGAGAVG
jgi:dTDP-glucose pyrophosphorylase